MVGLSLRTDAIFENFSSRGRNKKNEAVALIFFFLVFLSTKIIFDKIENIKTV